MSTTINFTRTFINTSRQTMHRLLASISFVFHYLQLRSVKVTHQKKHPVRKLIIINLIEHMGDIVACEPVSRYVKEKCADSYVIWAVRKPYKELIDSNPLIDRTLVVFCLTEWILLSKTALFDEVIDLHIQGRVCPICDLPLTKLVGNSEITLQNYYNFGNVMSSFTQSSGLTVPDTGPRVYISREIEDKVNSYSLPQNFITIHCESNEVCRDWPRHKWIKLLEKIFAHTGYYVVEIGSKSGLKGYRNTRFFNLCGKTSALETAEIIKRSKLFIGVDSGPAHLANAVGTFGVILLGHYREFTHYTPYSGSYGIGERAKIIREDGPAADIAVDKVFSCVMKH